MCVPQFFFLGGGGGVREGEGSSFSLGFIFGEAFSHNFKVCPHFLRLLYWNQEENKLLPMRE